MFYCPKCNKLENNFNPRESTRKRTATNIRDGYGKPIKHFQCECGNVLSGNVDTNGWDDDEKTIMYVKDLITQYNEGGIYFEQSLLDLANEIANKK